MRLSEYRNYYNSLDKYKKAFWIYLVLIFVEGTMRKWFMPGLSSAWMMRPYCDMDCLIAYGEQISKKQCG